MSTTTASDDCRDVLLIGDFLAEGAAWRDVSDRLERDGYRVTELAWRGPTALPASRAHDLPGLVEHVQRLRDASGVPHAHLVGVGFGGVLAQHVALAAPARVASLTLIGSWAHADRALRALLQWWIWAAQRAHAVDELLSVVFAVQRGPRAWESGAVDDAIVAAARGSLPSAFPALRDAFIAAAWAAATHDVREALPGLDVPALLLVGSLDAFAPERHSRALLDLLPHAELDVIGGAGHSLAQDRPEVVGPLLSRFFAGAAIDATSARPASAR